MYVEIDCMKIDIEKKSAFLRICNYAGMHSVSLR